MLLDKHNAIYITSQLDSIFSEYRGHCAKNMYLKQYLDFEQQEEAIMFVRERMASSFTGTSHQIWEAFVQVGNWYCQKGIPITELIDDINYLNQTIFAALDRQNESEAQRAYESFHIFFSTIKQAIYKAYFIDMCSLFIKRYQEEMSQTHYYRIHMSWMIKVLGYFTDHCDRSIPLIEYENKVFSQLLEMPETLLLFKEKSDLETLTKVNAELTTSAKSILHYIRHESYDRAFGLLQLFSYKSQQIINMMDKKILTYFKNREESFLAYVQGMIAHGKSGYLSIMEVNKLSLISKYKGLDASEHILNSVELIIKSIVTTMDEQILYIRTNNGEFYLFFPFQDMEYIDTIQTVIVEFIENQSFTLHDESTTIKVTMASVPVDQAVGSYLEKLLHYTLNKSNDEKEKVFYLPEGEKQNAIELIKKAHHDINFVYDAMLQKNLEIFFQPIIDLETGEIFDLEVLARIKNGEYYISAGEFIDLIYELGIVVDLDIQILEKVISYREKTKTITDRVFINVSPPSLRSKMYTDKMVETINTLKECGISVYFELTEQAFLDNIELIEQAHDKFGIKFAVDDFGTGYSSLKVVAELAEKKVIDFIKIDGSLVKNIHDSAELYHVLDATSYMTKNLKLHNIAEYIETEETMHRVKELGIRYGQGYYFSKPLTLDALIQKYKPQG